MEFRLVAATILACLALSACGSNVQLGGAQMGPITDELAGDDPDDAGVINEGTGSVIE